MRVPVEIISEQMNETLDKIYEDYLFDGRSESEREFISNLLKKQLNLTNKKYIEL